MVRRPASARTASAGVTQTRRAVETGMQWVFREQLFEDYGIDAQIEAVDGEAVLGRLVAVQIKTGPSYFASPAPGGGWWFRAHAKHFKYWINFAIPVVIVLVDLESGLCHWQLVTESTVEKSGESQWKLRVPAGHVLGSSAVRPLRDAADRRVRRERQPAGAPVIDFSAADLEVHSAEPGTDVLPEYIVRAHDRALDERIAAAVGPSARSGCTILVGGSCTGKTRALYEALHRRGPGSGVASLAESGWRVWPEVNPLPVKRFLDEVRSVGPRTIVWLNEAQRYLRDPSPDVRTAIATALLELLADDSRGPVLVLGTLWPEHWQELTRRPGDGEVDRSAAARRLLHGNYLRVPETFTNAEVIAARGSGDHRLVVAASQVRGSAVTQQLAGAPDLLQRYETVGTASRAVVHAMMDARRFGHGEWFPATFLRAAAACYLTGADHRGAVEDSSWFEAAVADLVVAGAASGPVVHESLLGYRLDDFLDQDGRVRRRFEFPPEQFWTVVAESDMSSESRIRMADGAAARLRLRIAAHLYEVDGTKAAGERLNGLVSHSAFSNAPDAAERLAQLAAEAGAPEALTSLAVFRRVRGGEGVERLLRQAAELGDIEAFTHLAFLLERAGDKEGAEEVARQAVDLGSWEATVSVASWLDIDFPNEAERLIYDLPEEMRWAALASFVDHRDSAGDSKGAERVAVAAADQGHLEVLLNVVDQRQERGDKAAARRLLARLPRPATPADALRVALSHARAGAPNKARTLLAGISGVRGLDHQIAAIVNAWPHLTKPLFGLLTELEGDVAARRLVGRLPPRRRRKSVPSDDADPTPDLAEADTEVADAYATLAAFHARRGEFDHAESLAMAASELRNSAGLEALSRELLQRGDRANAERLAMYAINIPEDESSASPDQESKNTLATARGDETLLAWGLEADGSTAKPW